MKYLFSFIFLWAFLSNGLSQPIQKVAYDEMIKTADALLELGDFYNARLWYEKANKDHESEELSLSMAYCDYSLKYYEKAEKVYSKVFSEELDNIFEEDRSIYARTLKYLGKYEEANKQFEIILKTSTDKEILSSAKFEIDGIEMSNTLPKNTNIDLQVADAVINSGFSEYSPTWFDKNTFYFSSFQRNKVIIEDGKEFDYHAKIYSSKLNHDRQMDKPKALDIIINRPGVHTSNVSFSLDHRTMYFTRQVIENNEIIDSKIYFSTLQDGDIWGEAFPLDKVNGEFLSTHPIEGEYLGEKVLFYSSNMVGGIGKFDIYYSIIKGNEYGLPVNLGEIINTEMDDVTPFYHKGNLYYSSLGFPTLGGYDVFNSKWDGSNWSKPTNLGHVYNSSTDDLYFRLDNNGTDGMLVSNRPNENKKTANSNTCCDDIFRFTSRDIDVDLTINYIDKRNNDTITDVKALVHNISQGGETKYLETKDKKNYQIDLKGESNYLLISTKEGYLPDTIKFSSKGILEDLVVNRTRKLNVDPNNNTEKVDSSIISNLGNIYEGMSETDKLKYSSNDLSKFNPKTDTIITDTIWETHSTNEAITLNNIYYDYNDWKILNDAARDLDILYNLLIKYPEMTIELSSHTDARGSEASNKRLSQKRAISAKDYLIKKGIKSVKIATVGYGESKILNHCKSNVECSEVEHRINRRTEFKILKGPENVIIMKERRKLLPKRK